jgi:phage shock protein PspC (stress-responsive transcriptional regulator)
LPRKLTRDTKHAVLAGVAAGFGRYLDVDPVLARLGFVLLAFVSGLGLLVYLAGWALMPREEAVPAGASGAGTPPVEGSAEPAGAAGFESLRDASNQIAAEVRKATTDPASAQLAIGSVLVVVGALLLADNLGLLHWPYWMRFETLWPLALVALGLGLVAKSRRTLSV